MRNRTRSAIKNTLKRSPLIANAARQCRDNFKLLKHSVGSRWPAVIRANASRVTIAVTAKCNARCIGCRYGRDFMPGHYLPLDLVNEVLDDASAHGVDTVRLYGGEPLLHPDIVKMVQRCKDLGIDPYVTTNGVLLGRKIDGLYDAGLRTLTIGFYGVGRDYDEYVQMDGLFDRVEASIATVRKKVGDEIQMQMNWLLKRPTCSTQAFRDACIFAEQYGMSIQIDLIHYSLPYFQAGFDNPLQFRPEDRPMLEEVVDEMIRVKHNKPWLLRQSLPLLRSIPDWLIKGPAMKVPCDAYEMIWIGADGSVQLCYAAFPLGNLHDKRLSEILAQMEYQQAARSAFQLKCPNCHCGADARIRRHSESLQVYSQPLCSESA